MLGLALSLVLTGLLLALPVMTWRAYKAGPARSGRRTSNLLPRLLAACAIIAWAAQILRYALLASSNGPIAVRQAIHATAPLGWLAWLAALAGLLIFAIFLIKRR